MQVEQNEDLKIAEFWEYVFWYSLAAMCPEVIKELNRKFGKIALYQLIKHFRYLKFDYQVSPGKSELGCGYWPSSCSAWLQIGRINIQESEVFNKNKTRRFHDFLYEGKGLSQILNDFATTKAFKNWAGESPKYWRFGDLLKDVEKLDPAQSGTQGIVIKELKENIKELGLQTKLNFSYQGAVITAYEKLSDIKENIILWIGVRKLEDLKRKKFRGNIGRIRLLQSESFAKGPREINYGLQQKIEDDQYSEVSRLSEKYQESDIRFGNLLPILYENSPITSPRYLKHCENSDYMYEYDDTTNVLRIIFLLSIMGHDVSFDLLYLYYGNIDLLETPVITPLSMILEYLCMIGCIIKYNDYYYIHDKNLNFKSLGLVLEGKAYALLSRFANWTIDNYGDIKHWGLAMLGIQDQLCVNIIQICRRLGLKEFTFDLAEKYVLKDGISASIVSNDLIRSCGIEEDYDLAVKYCCKVLKGKEGLKQLMMHSKFDWFGAMVRMMALIKMQMFQECHDIINKSKIEAFPKKTHAAFENLRLQAENGLKEKSSQR